MENLYEAALCWKKELMGKRGGMSFWVKNPKRISIAELRALRDAADTWVSFPSNYRWREDKICCIEELLTLINRQLDDAYNCISKEWESLQMYI